LPFWLHSF